ncbi:RuBisCO large subunit C-terminal-like domain-containing protein [Thiocystis violascens]|uniref:Ribulose 1,5-bisphosphate carboxylase, large subunit n=1 Tax=Thiocystis violascens (strain ATCC 17096 / DSM 198 / 6111) TaxID=765911 RepID=I3YAD2_THIV6|nr:RuBisCO large subunit C-terminal-like domain-containing protein [Thiocystis violascens]AFL73950.1 ribulose 1,5-bisphosphate carboxylase, large subunit [Thiocystis violascens DSM 198]
MKDSDWSGFFADAAALNPDAYIILDYYLECIGDPRIAAAHFCSEQSTAQWRRVGSSEDLRPRFAARVVDLTVLESGRPGFSYGIAHSQGGDVQACRVTIAHPHGNFGPRLPNLLSAVCGEGTFFSPGAPVVKLLDIHLPDAYLAEFEGPRFGVEGLRDLLQVYDRPLFFGVIKPNIGLPPEAFSDLGYQSWLGGLDIAKDDEMLGDTEWCPLARRSELLGAARQRAEQATGCPKFYLANITDEVERLIDLHDIAVANGANALLINAMPVGLSAVRMLRRHARVPLIAHFPFIAPFSRLPNFGVHSRVFAKLQRLAGFDAIIMPGFGERMHSSDDEVRENVAACLAPMGAIKPSLPVPGGSDWAGTLKGVYDKVGTIDFGFVPGRGVFGHPMGPRGGAASIRQAWDAIVAGVSLGEQAAKHVELRAAIETFGRNDIAPPDEAAGKCTGDES